MQIRPRIPDGLAVRIDQVRGDVPFGRWVVRACEERLVRVLEAGSGLEAGVEVSPVTEAPAGAVTTGSGVGSTPTGPASPRAPKKRSPLKVDPPVPQEQPTEADQQPQEDGMPTSVQLAQRAGVTLSVARRWLESGEWALYWT